MRYSVRFFAVAVSLLISQLAYSQLPSGGVVFDDFEYTSTTWCSEVQDACTAFPNDQPPAGSVFGRNAWHTNVSGTTTNVRAWYRYLWQEQENEDAGTSFEVTSGNNGHLTFRALAGSYNGHEAAGTIPRQIISGFTARRGTWAARVNFGDMEPAHVADFVQAFWTLSVAQGQAGVGDDRWNEFDYEWNSRFRDTSPPIDPNTYPYLRTGHTVGQSGSANDTHWPLMGPAWPDGNPRSLDDGPFDWSCKYVWGSFEVVAGLGGEDCSEVINQTYVDAQGNTPLYDPGIVLFLQITDNSVYYTVQSDGWGGVLVATSDSDSDVPNLPMAALFSQHIQSASTVNTTEDYSTDWFYYSPNTTININNVNQHVAFLRNNNIPRFNNTTTNLERPFAHLPGITNRPGRTTPLTLDFSLNPSSMTSGSTATLTALPPTRHGLFRFTWRYQIIYTNTSPSPWYALSDRYGGWEARFTFPTGSNVDRVQIEVTLEELDNTQNPPPVITTGVATPITDTFSISNASAPKKGASDAVPEAFSLDQNYPNPFNPSTEIRFALPEKTHVTLVISDLIGREVARLIDGDIDAGYQRVTWDGSGLPSGVYIYQLRTPRFTESKTMVLMK